MITAINIGNFKAFADAQRIPIRPLTLVYGANSSGKSSLIHGIVFARHALEKNDLDIHFTDVGGESVDLGGFRQYIHKRDWGRRMEWSVEMDTTFFTGRLAELLASIKQVTLAITIGIALDNQGRPVADAKPEINSYEMLGDGNSLLRMSKRRDGKLQLDRLNYDDVVFKKILKAIIESSTTTDYIQSSDYDELSNVISSMVSEIFAESKGFLPSELIRTRKKSSSGQGYLFPAEERVPLIPISKGRRTEDLTSAIDLYFPRILNEIVGGLRKSLEEELMKLHYLGPLRSYPPRHLGFSEQNDRNWYAGGGYTWDILRRDEKIRDLINKWLGSKERLHTQYALKIRNLLTIDDIDTHYDEIVTKIEERFTGEEQYNWDLFGELYSVLEKIKEQESSISDVQELNLVDLRSDTIVSHRDVGIGVSQVLPVLVSCYAHRNQIIAIEQPEIHLHPALQADLGDVFIESALGENKNRFLIETHSEHLLLRIMRRMRETSNGELPDGVPKVTPEDVCILFVQPKGTSSAVRHLELDEEGQLLDAWPGGFFEEGYRERFS